jgi:mRNA interferase MazF
MNRGEIWLINLAPTIGAEIKKTRPAIIISHNDIGILPLKVIVPITKWNERYSAAKWMIKLIPNSNNLLKKESCIDCLQIRCISEKRFVKKLGEIDKNILGKISKALSIVLCLDE